MKENSQKKKKLKKETVKKNKDSKTPKKVKIKEKKIETKDDEMKSALNMELGEIFPKNCPIILNEIGICQLASSIMSTKINEPSPLQNLEDKAIVDLGDLVGVEVLPKDLAARDRRKDAKFYDIENGIVNYVSQNCSCLKDNT